ncbi:MAG: HEAT repeat domain-containing protein, partial [Nitrospirota bacterium]
MADESERIPLDTRLLSNAIIELNISRRNVSIYPGDHPLVKKSLSRAFDFLQKLFELRAEITLAVAKDTLIIDDYFLDRKNPVYREFALHLSSLNIAAVTFISGLMIEELYEFHRLLSEKPIDTSKEKLQKELKERLIHIKMNFIDYDAFFFEEGKTERESQKGHIWERYIHGLLEGTLKTEDVSDVMREIPPETLAGLLNRSFTDDLRTKEETYDKVITTYIRKSSEGAFSSKELKRLIDFINGLRPELKKQFLSSGIRTIFIDIDSAGRALNKISVEEVIKLINTIDEQKIAIPDALKNLLEKFSELHKGGGEDLIFGGGLIMDDVFLSSDVVSLLTNGNFDKFVGDMYKKELQKILDFDAKTLVQKGMEEISRACSDELVERDFCHILLELNTSDVVSGDEYEYFVNVLKEQARQFVGTGQYGEVLKIFMVMEKNATEERFPDVTSAAIQYFNSEEFISLLIDSYRTIGRLMREEAILLIDYYEGRIIPHLMDALIEEDSQAVRRFLISLITHLGNKAIPEALKRLSDSRWFVKRNMLYILSECNGEEILPHVRSCCRHENPKVSFEAIKCLLRAGDSYGINALRDYLRAESREIVEQAIAISGVFKVREVVTDLIQMLRKKGKSGMDFYDKIPIVKALGQIGDPRALDALRDMLSVKSIIFKGAIERLWEEIYKTLKNYPYKDIKDLIEAGLKSKNEHIREESLRLKR